MSGSGGTTITMRSLSEVSDEETVHFGIDLVSAARKNVEFLRLVSDSHWLQEKSTIIEAIRRYDQLWMPLIADLTTGSKPPMILPPLDIEWVWFCHTLYPDSYRQYCESRFSKLIGKAAIFDEENEDYALNRCRDIWDYKYPSEPFENEADPDIDYYNSFICNEELLDQVSRQTNLYERFSEPYYSEIVYLVSSKQRYKGFICMIHRFRDECSCFVPTSDILLMWLTHQSYPTVYAVDVKDLEEDMKKIIRICEPVKAENFKQTKMLWERTYDKPYEKAGGESIAKPVSNETPFYWDVTTNDVNTRYKSMTPRFLIEALVSVKLISKSEKEISGEFLRLRTVKCHKELKLDRSVSSFTSDSWKKAWHLFCEFSTRGLLLDLRNKGGKCFKGSVLKESASFSWNELLRSPSLTSCKEMGDKKIRISASITPPVQGPYLLKCVPDRVTDDSGAMISEVILKQNRYRPQEGRWLSRTVLDHSGRECFVIRMRVGEGFWRRAGENPTNVKWEDRIIEITEGSWSYIEGSTSIGKCPDKVVGTAKPKEPPEGSEASWSFSNGNELIVKWDSSKSMSTLTCDLLLQGADSAESTVKILQGMQMQYQVKKHVLKNEEGAKGKESIDEEDGFMTIIRFSEDYPNGKATALINWKLLVLELLPEEDAVSALLVCVCILRSVSEMQRRDIGNLLVRRRVREVKLGDRDLGSVMVHPSSYTSDSVLSPYLQPWYLNAKTVMDSQVNDRVGGGASTSSYSQAEGGDKLYKSCIIP